VSYIRHYRRLSSGDRSLLTRAFFVMVLVRLGLSVMPFQTLRRFLARLAVVIRVAAPPFHAVPRIIWAIEAASRFLPAITCLTQALAAKVLLAHYGHAPALRIGVKKDADGKVCAHAWVEIDDGAVIGNINLIEYKPLPIAL